MEDRPQNEYNPYITPYPYIGWNNVLGGGGRDQGRDIYVPPQTNLYGAGEVAAMLSMPIVLIAIGMVLGYYIVPKVVKKIQKD